MNTLIQHSNFGPDGFLDLPCSYGRKRIPHTSRLKNSAVCYVELFSGSETKNHPDELGHFHRRMTEFYFFTRGEGIVRLNRTERPVRCGDMVIIPPGVCHTAVAGDQGLNFLVATLPPYDPQDSFDVFQSSDIRHAFSSSWVRRWRMDAQFTPNQPLVEDVADETNYGIYYAKLPGGWAIPSHRHAECEEFYFVTSGKADVRVGELEADVGAGSLVILPPDVDHELVAAEGGVEYLIVATPPVTTNNPPVRRTYPQQ